MIFLNTRIRLCLLRRCLWHKVFPESMVFPLEHLLESHLLCAACIHWLGVVSSVPVSGSSISSVTLWSVSEILDWNPLKNCFHTILFSWNTILPYIGCLDLFSYISLPFSSLPHYFMALHFNLGMLNRPSSYSTFICKVSSSVGCLFHSWNQRDLWEQEFQVVFFFKMVLVYSMRTSCIDEMHFEYIQYPPHFQLLSDSLLHTHSNSCP